MHSVTLASLKIFFIASFVCHEIFGLALLMAFVFAMHTTFCLYFIHVLSDILASLKSFVPPVFVCHKMFDLSASLMALFSLRIQLLFSVLLCAFRYSRFAKIFYRYRQFFVCHEMFDSALLMALFLSRMQILFWFNSYAFRYSGFAKIFCIASFPLP